jgi:hypothetical protein
MKTSDITIGDPIVESGSANSLQGSAITLAPVGGGVTGSSFNYVTTICNKCRKHAPLGGPMIDGIIVCDVCYEEYLVIDNTLPCPYKDPKRRKYNVKPKANGPQWSYTMSITTQAQTK